MGGNSQNRVIVKRKDIGYGNIMELYSKCEFVWASADNVPWNECYKVNPLHWSPLKTSRRMEFSWTFKEEGIQI